MNLSSNSEFWRAGWTLSSISGFSSAFARAVDSAVAIREQRRAPQVPANVGHGLVQGLTGLAEGVAAGLAAVVEAPIQVRGDLDHWRLWGWDWGPGV